MSFSQWVSAVIAAKPMVIALLISFTISWWVSALIRKRQQKAGSNPFSLSYLVFFTLFVLLSFVATSSIIGIVEQQSGRGAAEIMGFAGLIANFPLFMGLLIVEAVYLYWAEHYGSTF
jgi:hypothetical protein